ncbi:MAG TPA: SRPBCC family protein [Candidatus Binatia bacterium]|jgi:carbon monoxide dehydrogenase subunit G|nr:SRPBCC family protein [Candidatus Binatia bacterium]
MNFEHRCTIPVARGALWQFLMDVPQMATCVPGVESITASGDGQYAGRMRVKVGPIHLTLQGVVTIQERDQQQWRAMARAEANDRRVGGGVHLTAHMTLVESGPAATELAIQTQARLLGKLGEFGQPVIRKQADTIIAEFARNVAARFRSTAVAPQNESGQSEISLPRHQEPQQPVSSFRPFTVRALVGAVIGLGLALLLLTMLPLPASPLLAWSLVGVVTAGITALGSLVATSGHFLGFLRYTRG